jgi:hypothetical protein
VIVALHVATGAAAGAASGSRLAALLLGPVLHLTGDRLPHQDIRSRRFEIGSGLACLLLLGARRGPLDPATIGAAASSAPDLEHVLPFLRPGGSKLFHGRRGWHRSGRFPADLQLLLAGAILGVLIAQPSGVVRESRGTESRALETGQGPVEGARGAGSALDLDPAETPRPRRSPERKEKRLYSCGWHSHSPLNPKSLIAGLEASRRRVS